MVNLLIDANLDGHAELLGMRLGTETCVGRRLNAPVLNLYTRDLLIKLVTRYKDCPLNACSGSDPEVRYPAR